MRIAVVLAVVMLLATGCAPQDDGRSGNVEAAQSEVIPVVEAFDGLKADLKLGIPYSDYSDALQEVNRQVEAFDPQTREGIVAKVDLQEAVHYYVAAREAWSIENASGVWPGDVETAVHWRDEYPEVVRTHPEILEPFPELANNWDRPQLEARSNYTNPEAIMQTAWEVAGRKVLSAVRRAE